jgi:preprotein translocase subunit SecA
VEYKHEAFGIFKSMMDQIYRDVAHNLFRVTITRLSSFDELLASMPQEMIHQTFEQFDGALPPGLPQEPPEETVEPEIPVTFHREAPKVGRNAPCPCGSGKKYKNCCGKNK